MNQQLIALTDEQDEEFCSAVEHLRSICKQENQELLVIPAVKNNFFHISNYSESAFNTHDFFEDVSEFSMTKEEYAKQEDLKRANQLAMLASCITNKEMFDREKARFWGIAEKLDQIRNAYKVKLEASNDRSQKQSLAKKIANIDSQLEEIQNIWDHWMNDLEFS